MPVVGITGGICTGKTTFAECLREVAPGAFFFNADAAARELADNDAEVRELISREFGADMYAGSGLNRQKLRTIVFADAARRRALERILHPRIREQWSSEAARRRHELFFADIPLLYETAGERLCDQVVVVACSGATQLRRLMDRARLDETAARQMIDSQMPLSEKIKRADHVVWNNGDRATLAWQAGVLVRSWQQ